MCNYETEHYIFNYTAGSKAEEDILLIASVQEACYAYICQVLGVTLNFKIEYFLCNSPEEVGTIYGDNEPCNAFTRPPNKIYAVYNENLKCIGFHEDAHIISYTINRPKSAAVREGLAMYFDRKWWGISNLDWTLYYLKNNKYISVIELLNNDTFFKEDCSLTYPIVGAFTEWLINSYGIEKYLFVYKENDAFFALEKEYGVTPDVLEQQFKKYVALFKIDEVIEQRINELLLSNKK
ncbi:MAG: hypothetical protein ACOX3C_01725 [Bacilli bacterium]|jgi:hypothetical protein